jgi:hypothetical protein
LIINSELFIDNVLTQINAATDGHNVTAYGTFIQAILLGGSYLVAQPLASYDYI